MFARSIFSVCLAGVLLLAVNAAYAAKDNPDKAIRDLTEAIRLKPDYAKAYYSRSISHEQKGELVKAKEDLARAKQLEAGAK